MHKLFNKIFLGIASAILILIVVGTLPPLGTVIAILLDEAGEFDRSSAIPVAEIVAPEVAENTPGPIPKASLELMDSSLNRMPARGLSFDCSVLADEVKVLVELYSYVHNNDLRFNIPPITYRQPSSEHSSEG